MDWAHVLVIVQCRTDGCSLSCKDGALVWQSFGQVVAGYLTILEMAVDDRRSPHSLINFGAIDVDFITWSLRFMILIELSPGFLSWDHTFAYPFHEFVSFGIVIVRSWWKVGCPQGQTNSGLISAEVMASCTLRPTEGAGVGSCPLYHPTRLSTVCNYMFSCLI